MSHSYQPRQTERTDFVAVLAKVCLVTFLTSLGIVVLYPLFWMALNGFKTNAEIFGNPFALPSGFSITNYIAAWNQGIRNYIATSGIVTSLLAGARYWAACTGDCRGAGAPGGGAPPARGGVLGGD